MLREGGPVWSGLVSVLRFVVVVRVSLLLHLRRDSSDYCQLSSTHGQKQSAVTQHLQHLFQIDIFCSIMTVSTATFDQFNAK